MNKRLTVHDPRPGKMARQRPRSFDASTFQPLLDRFQRERAIEAAEAHEMPAEPLFGEQCPANGDRNGSRGVLGQIVENLFGVQLHLAVRAAEAFRSESYRGLRIEFGHLLAGR